MELNKIELLTIIFTSLNIIFLIITLFFYNEEHTILQKFKKNWEQKPIIDIKIDCTNQTSLISSKLYGHSTYCNCTNKNNSNNKIYNNSCLKEDEKLGCKTYNKLNESDLFYYRGKKLCIERANESYHYFISNEILQMKNLSIIGIVDTFNTSYGFLNNTYLYPITNLHIVNQTNINLPIYNTYNKIPLNENYYLIYNKNYSSNINNNIVVDVEISFNDKICSNPNEGIFSKNNFKFNNNKGEENCKNIISNKKYDNDYKLIDSYSAEKFFKDNNISDYDYLNIKNKSINLFTMNYYGIKKECYKELEVKKVFEKNYDYNVIKISILIMIIWYLIFIFLIIKQVKYIINDIVGFLFINIVLQLLIGLFGYSSIAPFLLYKSNCVGGIVIEWFKKCFFNINIAFYFYSFGFICNFIIMLIVYCIENPNVEIMNDESLSINMINSINYYKNEEVTTNMGW